MYKFLSDDQIQANFSAAKQSYSLLGVDVDAAMARAATIPLSLHCWQGDDVGGFEKSTDQLTGGIMATGNHPGKARTPAELRADIEQAAALIPGAKKVNVHALYAETNALITEFIYTDTLAPDTRQFI